VNVLVVVVRYFGGTLLGVPGLIHAYRSAAALALQLTPRMEKQVEQEFKIHFDYTQMNEVMMVVRQYNCRIIKQDIQLFCDMVLAIPKNRVAEVLYKLQEMRNIEISPVQG
jgi:putative IMPACT (imprinted ancient) family translation regulator